MSHSYILAFYNNWQNTPAEACTQLNGLTTELNCVRPLKSSSLTWASTEPGIKLWQSAYLKANEGSATDVWQPWKCNITKTHKSESQSVLLSCTIFFFPLQLFDVLTAGNIPPLHRSLEQEQLCHRDHIPFKAHLVTILLSPFHHTSHLSWHCLLSSCPSPCRDHLGRMLPSIQQP